MRPRLDDRDMLILRGMVTARLQALAEAPQSPAPVLVEALRYALLAPAKHVRAILTLLAARACGAPPAVALDAACAVEMVHAASLVFDDLPAMDDAATRRGQDCAHRVYGEARAILVGIGLLNRAYQVIAADQGLAPAARVALADALGRAIGLEGLIAGQDADLHAQRQGTGLEGVRSIHDGKTAALFAAAAEMGAIAAMAPEPTMLALGRFGRRMGLAFQALDDLYDIAAAETARCKDTGKDAERPCLSAILTPEAIEREAWAQMDQALQALEEADCASKELSAFASHVFTLMRARLEPALLAEAAL